MKRDILEFEQAWHTHAAGLLVWLGLSSLSLIWMSLAGGVVMTIILFWLVYWSGRDYSNIVPVGWVGVLTFLRGRTMVLLPEGRCWTPPFLTSITPVTAKELAIRVSVGKVATKREKLSTDSAPDRPEKNLWEAGATVDLVWSVILRIDDPWRFLGAASNPLGNWTEASAELTKGGVHQQLDTFGRTFATQNDFEQILSYKGKHVLENGAPVETAGLVEEGKKLIQQLRSWGVELLMVKLQDVTIPKAIEEKQNRIQEEDFERTIEQRDIGSFNSRVKEVIKESVGPDGKPQATWKEARETVLVRAKNAKMTIVAGGAIPIVNVPQGKEE